MKQQIRT